MCSDMSDMCERDPVCDIPPIHGKSAKDTRAGRSAAVDMAEPGDTLEKIAADELARILKVTEVLKGIPDNAMRKARQEKMPSFLLYDCVIYHHIAFLLLSYNASCAVSRI